MYQWIDFERSSVKFEQESSEIYAEITEITEVTEITGGTELMTRHRII
jgi:hypothetical protein